MQSLQVIQKHLFIRRLAQLRVKQRLFRFLAAELVVPGLEFDDGILQDVALSALKDFLMMVFEQCLQALQGLVAFVAVVENGEGVIELFHAKYMCGL